jgi:tRNA-binding protein
MSDYISIDDFKKAEIRVGEITSAEPVAGSEKLLRLVVDFGLKPSKEGSADHPVDGVGEHEERQVVSGIAKYFPDLSQLVGKRCAFVTNLEPRKLMGLESQAMILATGGDPTPDGTGVEPLYLFESSAPLGSRAR